MANEIMHLQYFSYCKQQQLNGSISDMRIKPLNNASCVFTSQLSQHSDGTIHRMMRKRMEQRIISNNCSIHI